jgi:hypothetical protein
MAAHVFLHRAKEHVTICWHSCNLGLFSLNADLGQSGFAAIDCLVAIMCSLTGLDWCAGCRQVPNLFDTGESLAIGEAVRSRAKAMGMDGSRADLMTFFVSEVGRCGYRNS